MNQAPRSRTTRRFWGWMGMAALAVAVLMPAAGQAGPSGFRCPTSGRLISVGASTHEVRTRCREPDEARTTVEVRTIRERVTRWINGVAQEVVVERSVEIPVEEWTYDFGCGRFIQFLRFEYGKLLSVGSGPKGAAAEAD